MAAARTSKNFGYLFGAWLILTACLVVGLVIMAIDRAAANQFKIANVDLTQLTGPAATSTEDGDPSLAARNLADRFGPPVTYGAMEWTVVSSRLIPGADNASSRPIIVSEVVVANASGDTATRVRSSDVALIWPDGHRQEVDRFEFIDDRRVFSLEPGESLLVTLVFKPNLLANPDLGELNLIVGDHGRVPALLPLLGRAPQSEFPLVATMDAQPIAMIGGGLTDAEILIAADRATVDLNAGHYRAAAGQRVLTIEASVTSPVGGLIGGSIDGPLAGEAALYMDPSFWRLSVDGRPTRPLRVKANDGGVTLLFAIDAEPVEMILSGGTSSRDEFRSTIAMPDRTG